MSWGYSPEPRNPTAADLIRDAAFGPAVLAAIQDPRLRGYLVDRSVPQRAIDIPMVTDLPGSPQDRDQVNLLDTDTGTYRPMLYQAATATWLEIRAAGDEPGRIGWQASATAPTGWLIADGTAVSRTTYVALFAEVGTDWGAGDGSTTFNLPDLRDRMPIGSGSTYALGATGGAATATLALANLPSHSHTISGDGGHSHTVAGGAMLVNAGAGSYGAGANPLGNGSISSVADHSHGGATGAVGSGTPHTNMPPYVGLTPIIRT